MRLLSPYFIILCIFLPLLANAQTNNNITIGSSLTAGDHNSPAWTSPSKHFAFGFQQVDQSDNFLLAIWFDMIPDKTITWSANRNQLVPKGSKVQLTSNNGLVLTDPDGDEVWNSRNGDTVSYGAMLDTGNFVLATQASKVIWQSFDEPTDTMLPTQVLNLGAQLIARYSSANYSSGRFMIQLDADGNLSFDTTSFPLYDSINSKYLSSQGSGYQVQFNQTGSLNLVANNGTVIYQLIDDDDIGQDFYQRAIFEYDGVLRHYVYPKNQSSVSGSWSVRSYKPDNICTAITQETGSGVCGFNSYCQLGNDKRPYCSCPPGYTLLDPNNPMGGCSQDFAPQMCEGQSDEDIRNKFNFTTLINVDWPLSDYEHYENVTKDWCRDICLPDCFCAVSVFKDGGDCWKKKLPLSNGKTDTSVGRTTFIKVGTSNDKWITANKSSSKLWPSLFGVSGFINVIFSIILFFVLFCFSSRKRFMHGSSKAMVQTDYTIRSFSYSELSEATNGFKEEVGRGAFGVVYKGVLVGVSGTQTYIAVKKLDGILQNPNKEFKAEVNAIGYTHHKNLVRLIGFCEEDEHRLLVYEYMSNGTLADYLYLPPKPAWEKRLKIAYGIARGLLYLHEDCTNQVIHCDIKPQNILLDAEHNARISDFGLAKLLRLDQTQTNTVARGTRGYIAPEWFKNKPVTAKVDVYSFGTLLLEIICCKKNVSGRDCEGFVVLTDRAFDCYLDGNIEDLVEDDIEALEDKQRMEKMVKISLWCIQDEVNLRPSMRMVVQMLEGVIQVPDPPYPNSYSISITR